MEKPERAFFITIKSTIHVTELLRTVSKNLTVKKLENACNSGQKVYNNKCQGY